MEALIKPAIPEKRRFYRIRQRVTGYRFRG